MGLKKITKRDKPEVLASAERTYGALLFDALDLARRRAARSSRTIQDLYASATVEGRASKANIKASVISFSAPPFHRGLHYIHPWDFLAISSRTELAAELSWLLRSAIREKDKVLAKMTPSLGLQRIG
jgi:hypothetical protein